MGVGSVSTVGSVSNWLPPKRTSSVESRST
jgi:hypothetical protein